MVEYSALMTACWRYELSQREVPVPGELRRLARRTGDTTR